MNFPSIISIIEYHHFFLISGPLTITVGFFLIRAMRMYKGKRPPISLMIGPPLAFLLGGYHIWNTGIQVRNAYLFRDIEPSKIESLEIESMGRSSRVTGDAAPKVVTNFLQALSSLEYSEPISRSTADLINGYRVKINMKSDKVGNSKSLYLSAYDQRSGSGPDAPFAIVVPHIGPEITPNTHGGYYTNAEFLKWLRDLP